MAQAYMHTDKHGSVKPRPDQRNNVSTEPHTQKPQRRQNQLEPYAPTLGKGVCTVYVCLLYLHPRERMNA